MIKNHVFKGKKDGPHLLVFGAIHGNERCGSYGIKQVAALMTEGWLKLKAGRLTMVPVCNQKAFDEGTAYQEENLNRVFRYHANPATHEQRLANQLTPLVDSCDYFLDLHSQSAEGPPLVFQETEGKEIDAFAKAIHVPYRVKGWADMTDENPDGQDMDTTEKYAHAQGKPGILVECGQHSDPRAPGVAYTTIIDALAHLGMINAPDAVPACRQTVIRMHTVLRNFAEGGALSKRWNHLQSVEAGEILARSNNRRTIIMPDAGVIILPKNGKNVSPGGELGYLGRFENTPGL